jgi:hypothetical protein
MKKQVYILSILLLTTLIVNAQDTLVSKKKWHYLGEIYLMFPTMSGSMGIRNLPDVDLDVDAGDIFSHLKMGAMFYFEAANDKWAINSDLLYMKLGQDATPGTVIVSGDVTAKQLGWEVAGLRRVTPWLELGLGGLLNSLSTTVNITRNDIGEGTTSNSAEISETWFDPMLVARIMNQPDKKFLYLLRGDVGGFGLGSGSSNFAWEVQAYAGYRFSKLFQMTAGYRIIGLDFETGEGQYRFLYDVNTYGPVVRFGFNF